MKIIGWIIDETHGDETGPVKATRILSGHFAGLDFDKAQALETACTERQGQPGGPWEVL